MLYLDGAATKEVSLISKMAVKEGISNWGNPSSNNDLADKAKSLVRVARRKVADSIGADEKEIIFTSGGSESDNMAIKGVIFASEKGSKHIVTSKIEHKAVLETCKFLEKHKLASVTYVDVDENGIVDLQQLEDSINENTVLISIMAVNNEIGTIQPVTEIGKIAKKHGVLFHTDAVQAYGKIKIDVREMNVDLLSASGHKIGTPKGIGFLYVKSGTQIEPLIHGGGQEFGLRAGTENVPYINALGYEAAAIDTNTHYMNLKQNVVRLTEKLNEYFGDEIRYVVNSNNALGIVNIGFEGIDAVAIQAFQSLNGIQVSIGSACNTGAKTPSHVLEAIGVPEDMLYSYFRVTVPEQLTDSEIDHFIKVLDLGRKLFSLKKKG